VGEHHRALVRDRSVKLVGGVGEQLDTILDQIASSEIPDFSSSASTRLASSIFSSRLSRTLP
jgi:hypothetical protein